jgi:hypothetical protein
LEIVVVAGLGLDLSPLPNRTTSAFDFRRHQFEYAPTAVAIKPKSSSPIIVVGMNPHIRPDLLVFSLIICTGGAYRPFLHNRHFSAVDGCVKS